MDSSMFFTVAMSTLILLAFAGLFLAWFFIKRARFKEKIILIEKGIDIKDLHIIESKKSNFSWLKIGILLTGIAVGCLIISFILISPNGQKFNIPGFTFGIILFTAGASMILANYVAGDKDQK